MNAPGSLRSFIAATVCGPRWDEDQGEDPSRGPRGSSVNCDGGGNLRADPPSQTRSRPMRNFADQQRQFVTPPKTPLRSTRADAEVCRCKLLELLNWDTPPGPTTQSPQSLITETLRELAALARPVRHVIFDIWSPAGEAGRNLGLVSGQKNSGPGATCLETGNLMGPGQVSRIGGTIQRGNRARPLLQCPDHRPRPVRAWVRQRQGLSFD